MNLPQSEHQRKIRNISHERCYTIGHIQVKNRENHISHRTRTTQRALYITEKDGNHILFPHSQNIALEKAIVSFVRDLAKILIKKQKIIINYSVLSKY
jgi:hypothetical protein